MIRFYLCVKGGDVVEPVDGLAAGHEVDAGIGDLLQMHIGADSETGGISDMNYCTIAIIAQIQLPTMPHLKSTFRLFSSSFSNDLRASLIWFSLMSTPMTRSK